MPLDPNKIWARIVERCRKAYQVVSAKEDATPREKELRQEELGLALAVEAILPLTPMAAMLAPETTAPCRACGERVVFTTMAESGKANPVNAEQDAAVVTRDGRVVKGKIVGILVVGSGGYAFGRVSHFATCPKADEFRKK